MDLQGAVAPFVVGAVMQSVYEIVRLTNGFYKDYPHTKFPEIAYKGSRQIDLILFETNDYYVGVPFRSHIKHKNMFSLGKAQEDGSKPGLDYSKILIITNNSYIKETATIDNEQMKVFLHNVATICNEVYEYVQTYILHTKGQIKLDINEYNNKYRYTTLKYFHKELGL